MNKRAYSVQEAADYLALSRNEIHKLIKANKIAARKHGTKTLIDVSELDAYFESLSEVA